MGTRASAVALALRQVSLIPALVGLQAICRCPLVGLCERHLEDEL
jgi:hypothetical protein